MYEVYTYIYIYIMNMSEGFRVSLCLTSIIWKFDDGMTARTPVYYSEARDLSLATLQNA